MRQQTLWDRIVLLVVVVMVLGVATWWIESRFGSQAALLALGGVLGISAFMFGRRSAVLDVQHGLDAGADNADRLVETSLKLLDVQRALASGYAAQMRAGAQLGVIDEKRVEQLARQRAALLMEVERARMGQGVEGPSWESVPFEYGESK